MIAVATLGTKEFCSRQSWKCSESKNVLNSAVLLGFYMIFRSQCSRASLTLKFLSFHKGSQRATYWKQIRFNKPNNDKMFITWIYLKNWTFLSLKIIVDPDWCQEWNIKWSLLKISWNKQVILLSDANVQVRFRTQQRAKYSSLQFAANCIAAIRCLRYYVKLIWELPIAEDTYFHRH